MGGREKDECLEGKNWGSERGVRKRGRDVKGEVCAIYLGVRVDMTLFALSFSPRHRVICVMGYHLTRERVVGRMNGVETRE